MSLKHCVRLGMKSSEEHNDQVFVQVKVVGSPNINTICDTVLVPPINVMKIPISQENDHTANAMITIFACLILGFIL